MEDDLVWMTTGQEGRAAVASVGIKTGVHGLVARAAR